MARLTMLFPYSALPSSVLYRTCADLSGRARPTARFLGHGTFLGGALCHWASDGCTDGPLPTRVEKCRRTCVARLPQVKQAWYPRRHPSSGPVGGAWTHPRTAPVCSGGKQRQRKVAQQVPCEGYHIPPYSATPGSAFVTPRRQKKSSGCPSSPSGSDRRALFGSSSFSNCHRRGGICRGSEGTVRDEGWHVAAAVGDLLTVADGDSSSEGGRGMVPLLCDETQPVGQR